MCTACLTRAEQTGAPIFSRTIAMTPRTSQIKGCVVHTIVSWCEYMTYTMPKKHNCIAERVN